MDQVTWEVREHEVLSRREKYYLHVKIITRGSFQAVKCGRVNRSKLLLAERHMKKLEFLFLSAQTLSSCT
jgi:hypothetical protein